MANLPLVLGCDANAHHWKWGSSDCNNRGESLLEFILSNNLEISNVGCQPTFVTRAREEVLDVTLSNHLANGLITQWRVSTEPSLSDHRIIKFKVGLVVGNRTEVRNPRNVNWSKYNDILGHSARVLCITAVKVDAEESKRGQLLWRAS